MPDSQQPKLADFDHSIICQHAQIGTRHPCTVQGDVEAFKNYSLEDAKGGRAVPDPQQPKLEKKPKKDEPEQKQDKPQPQKSQQQEQKAPSPPMQSSGIQERQHCIDEHFKGRGATQSLYQAVIKCTLQQALRINPEYAYVCPCCCCCCWQSEEVLLLRLFYGRACHQVATLTYHTRAAMAYNLACTFGTHICFAVLS